MKSKSLMFEILSILTVLALGIAMLSFDLPGWNLLIVAAVLSVTSLSFRKLVSRNPRSFQTANQGAE